MPNVSLLLIGETDKLGQASFSCAFADVELFTIDTDDVEEDDDDDIVTEAATN